MDTDGPPAFKRPFGALRPNGLPAAGPQGLVPVQTAPPVPPVELSPAQQRRQQVADVRMAEQLAVMPVVVDSSLAGKALAQEVLMVS